MQKTETSRALSEAPGSLRFRVIAYNPQTRKDEDSEIIEAESWEEAWRTVRSRYNYPRRMIPIPDDVIVFPIQANTQGEPGQRPRL